MNALVLSGGGAYGAYEVGVVQALFEKQVLGAIEVVTGTSVGAFNAALLAAHGGGPGAVARLHDVWLHRIAAAAPGAGNGVLRIRGNLLDLLRPADLLGRPAQSAARLVEEGAFLLRAGLDRGAAFLTSSRGFATRAVELMDIAAFISVEPLRQTIAGEISCERIREGPVQLRVVATDWERGGFRVFENAQIQPDVVLASTAIPGLFPPVRFDNTTWVDGGVTMNTPLKPAIAAGAEVVHLVSLDSSLHAVPASELNCSVEALMRTAAVAILTTIREDMATVQWINRGIAALRRAAAGGDLSNSEVRDFTRVAAQLERRAQAETGLRMLTIHHYHPQQTLGGPLGLLDFGRDAIAASIARGRADTLAHDCARSGCILPEAGYLTATAS